MCSSVNNACYQVLRKAMLCYLICYRCTSQKASSGGTPLADISQPVQKIVDFLATQDQVIHSVLTKFFKFFIQGQALAQVFSLCVRQQEPTQHQEPAI